LDQQSFVVSTESYIHEHKTAGDNVNLTVYRDGKMLNLTVNLKP